MRPIFVALAVVFAVPVSALEQDLSISGSKIEAECKLEHLRRTASAVARSYIGKACNFRGLPTNSFELARTERVFHDCILEALPGTEDDRNATELANACRDRAWSK